MAAIYDISYVLCHVPDLVQYGSKPQREVHAHPDLQSTLQQSLRNFGQAASYPPHQAFIGALAPVALRHIPRPWYEHPEPPCSEGRWGSLVEERFFYAVLNAGDSADLVRIEPEMAPALQASMDEHRLTQGLGLRLQTTTQSNHNLHETLALEWNHAPVARIRGDHPEDEALTPGILLENLSSKASAFLAAREWFVRHHAIGPQAIDFIISTGEEAIGDRYQRGGGSLSKAVGEMAGCVNATGFDLKAFCSAPVHAIPVAAAMVDSGLYRYVMVVGGGSLAKLGMKFLNHLRLGAPILEDVLGAFAYVVGPDRPGTAHIRLDAVGRHPIGAGSQPQAIYEALVAQPLDRLGLGFLDIDQYAVEMHNPDITGSGGGDVPLTNYRTLAALAIMHGEARPDDMEGLVERFGVPGFSPTQGHIAAAVPLLGSMLESFRSNQMQRGMLVAKGSLFLGRMTRISDGVSVVLEAQ